MLEYLIIIKRRIIYKSDLELIQSEYNERSILEKDDTSFEVKFYEGKAMLLGRHRHDYQGHPVFIGNDSFTCLVGYIVSKEFHNN